jgi:hypothetical protein
LTVAAGGATWTDASSTATPSGTTSAVTPFDARPDDD